MASTVRTFHSCYGEQLLVAIKDINIQNGNLVPEIHITEEVFCSR